MSNSTSRSVDDREPAVAEQRVFQHPYPAGVGAPADHGRGHRPRGIRLRDAPYRERGHRAHGAAGLRPRTGHDGTGGARAARRRTPPPATTRTTTARACPRGSARCSPSIRTWAPWRTRRSVSWRGRTSSTARAGGRRPVRGPLVHAGPGRGREKDHNVVRGRCGPFDRVWSGYTGEMRFFIPIDTGRSLGAHRPGTRRAPGVAHPTATAPAAPCADVPGSGRAAARRASGRCPVPRRSVPVSSPGRSAFR